MQEIRNEREKSLRTEGRTGRCTDVSRINTTDDAWRGNSEEGEEKPKEPEKETKRMWKPRRQKDRAPRGPREAGDEAHARKETGIVELRRRLLVGNRCSATS